jgi:hypothetical protein
MRLGFCTFYLLLFINNAKWKEKCLKLRAKVVLQSASRKRLTASNTVKHTVPTS